MGVISLATLLVKETKATIYATGIRIAAAINLPVTSWQAGDPTRAIFYLESELLEILGTMAVGFIGSGFLEYADAAWRKIHAKQTFNVDVPDATFATTNVVLTNNGGGFYDIEPNDITFRVTATGQTFHNTQGGILASGPGTTLPLAVEADEAGSAGSAGAGEIDDIVSGLDGVTCTNPVAAIGVDEWDQTTTIAQCHDKLGSLSPNGPKDAYAFVARNRDLTGTGAVTRARAYEDSDTGEVTIYLAGPGGAITEPDRLLVEAAIATNSTPLCITPTVVSATNVAVAVTYEIWIYKSVNKTAAEVQADILDELEGMIAGRDIGGDIIPPATTGFISKSLVDSTVQSKFKQQTFKVSVSIPSADTALANGEVAALGAVVGTIHFIPDPT